MSRTKTRPAQVRDASSAWPIVIVDYVDAWPTQATSMVQKIQDALGTLALSVDHIGSTSVRGLAAKPVIDVLLVVANIEDEDAYVVPLESIGLRLRVREQVTGSR